MLSRLASSIDVFHDAQCGTWTIVVGLVEVVHVRGYVVLSRIVVYAVIAENVFKCAYVGGVHAFLDVYGADDDMIVGAQPVEDFTNCLELFEL